MINGIYGIPVTGPSTYFYQKDMIVNYCTVVFFGGVLIA